MEINNTMRFICEFQGKSRNIFQYQGKFIDSESRENPTFRQFQTACEKINVSCTPYITASVSGVKS